MTASTELRALALNLFQERCPQIKAAQVQALHVQSVDPSWQHGLHLDEAGRPDRPFLRSAKEVPSRTPFTPEGHAALLHSITHIEFNAINLALDAVWRFPHMPQQYYLDWARVAQEEALHFSLLRAHLNTLGYDYGDFDAHDGLWFMAQRTKDNIVARMALVPRTLEARGLDAMPQVQLKLKKAGDHAAVKILDLILRDEVGHVAVGNHWFQYLCTQQGIAPLPHYRQLFRQYSAPKLRPPFNMAARKAAGFSEEEIAFLLEEPSIEGATTPR